MTGGRPKGQAWAGARLARPHAGSSPALPTTPPLGRGNPSAQGPPRAGAPGRHIPVTAGEVLAAALLVGCLFWAGWWAAGVPTVYRAWPDGRCVTVAPPSSWSCAEPPALYDTVWVSPAWRPPAGRGGE